MNKLRRKEIAEIQNRLEKLKEEVENVMLDLESIQEAEQDYFDNMPEGIQAGEKGDKAQESIDNLSEAVDMLNTITDEFEEIFNSLESAVSN